MREEIQKYQQAAQLLQDCLELEYPPVAIKLAKSEEEIPENAVRPMRDLGVHYAECQCIAKARVDGKTYALTLKAGSRLSAMALWMYKKAIRIMRL